MAKYNIYKIKNQKLDELITHLVSDRHYHLVNSQSQSGYELRTYFSGPDDANELTP